MADDSFCELLTESSALLKASAKFTFAAGASVWIAGIFASGRVAADFSCAIIASILLLSIPPVFTLPPDSGLFLPVAPREQNSGLQGNDGYNNFRHMLPGFHNTSANASRSAEQAAKAPSIWTIEARDSGG
ncbi:MULTISPECIES: hypothetical protein [unclassified Janthinobacterium]|uniref:hypothetical protein n=1 Tax=unclassified Janthinobacterium TaxID=2610881 RepID=UPI00258E9D9A|nr:MULTISPECIES: hypothetical protein [unclassified Janthinobacterium]MCX7294975.1 hypothetical protein [Janthinobacterium sp.]MED5594373.1 hypothetical protein [Janthinobacterium sp. P210006]